MTKKAADDVSIGKFDILATFTYARALRDGDAEDDAKVKGIVAAVMGAQARQGHPHGGKAHDAARKSAAEAKKATTITAESFDRQVSEKMGAYFDKTFLPAMKRLVDAGLDYDEIKRVVKIPTTWGAKVGGEAFEGRVADALKKGKS